MQMLSTYRIQLHKGFTFAQATGIIPYLHDLGITHIYASPYLKAVAGSTHGYDVIDHSRLNPEIGSTDDYRHFVATLSAHDMSHILDTVPNHMGVDTNDNPWWNDVLEHGIHSKFANYFDIDWDQFPSRSQLLNKVLLPVLGEPYAEVIEKRQLQLRTDNGKVFLHYYDRRFPIAGESTDQLHDLLQKQNYRICHWKVAADEINYRRFFDVTSLAALKMERQDVFDAAHDFTFDLIADGSVAGLRVDHPDGLLDPKKYFERLQEKFKRACPKQAANGQTLYVSVEKILNGDEKLRQDWPVAGTSGYDFLCAVNDLFVDPENEPKLTAIYNEFIGDSTSYAELVYQKKRMILETSLASEWTALAKRLDVLAQADLSSRDFTFNQLKIALAELISRFPVYRSYVSDRGVDAADEWAMQQAMLPVDSKTPADGSVLQFVADSVMLRHPVPADIRPMQLAFAQRFQQLTSPVNAKGIEDTVFYIYNRLSSLNEVGGDPGRFGRSAEAIHQYFQHRQQHWPLALSSLSTHDTKRSEDVRARINVLSEIPGEWEQHLKKWREINAPISPEIHSNDQYLFYQTLIGVWPAADMDDSIRSHLVERLMAYMQKAMREAKQRTSWTAVNEKYEAAVSKWIAQLIDPKISDSFLQNFIPFQEKISRIGLNNTMAQTAIRLTAPGIPDTYQGTELLDLSLVDPDNRRPVDYQRRSQFLKQADQRPAKLHLTTQLLQLRCKFSAVFIQGDYIPILAKGQRSKNIFSFARVRQDQWIITVVSRLLASQGEEPWGDTEIILPNECRVSGFEDAVSGSCHRMDRLMVSQILKTASAAVLVSTP